MSHGELIDLTGISALCERALAAGRNQQPSTWQASVQATCAFGATPDVAFAVITQGVKATAFNSGWLLSGSVSAALMSDSSPKILAVLADVDGCPAVFTIPADAEGLLTTAVESLDGLLALNASFERVRASAASMRRLSDLDFFAPALISLSAEIIGASSAALELVLARARARRVFDRPIGSFQALAHRLVDAWIDLEAMQLALQETVEDGASSVGASALKALCSVAGPRIVFTAQQVHGGEGYHADLPLPSYTRRVLGLSHRLGSVPEHHGQLLLQITQPSARSPIG